MDAEKRKKYLPLIIIGAVIIFSILWFIWGRFINRGEIILSGNAPFDIEVFDELTTECPQSPCTVQVRAGQKNLVIRKTGYLEQLLTPEVPILGEIAIDLQFQIEPYIQALNQFPQPPADFVLYQLTETADQQAQKLVEIDDPQARPIVTFPQNIDLVTIWGNERAALILDEDNLGTGYYIDIVGQEKSLIQDPALTDLFDGKWSPSGLYFVFKRDSSDFLWLLDYQGNIQELDLIEPLDQVSWSPDDQLYFSTIRQLGDGIFADSAEELAITFGYYSPEQDSYQRIGVYSNLNGLATNLLVTGNKDAIYFQVGESYYSLVLK